MIINLYKRTIAIILAAMFLICIPLFVIADDDNKNGSELPDWALSFIEYYDIGQDKYDYKKYYYGDGCIKYSGTNSNGDTIVLAYNPNQELLSVYQKNDVVPIHYNYFFCGGDGYSSQRIFGEVTKSAKDVTENKIYSSSEQAFNYRFYKQGYKYENCWSISGMGENMCYMSSGQIECSDPIYVELSYDPKTGFRSESVEYKDSAEMTLKDISLAKTMIQADGGQYSVEVPETDETIYGSTFVYPVLSYINISDSHKEKMGTFHKRTYIKQGVLESETVKTNDKRIYSYSTTTSDPDPARQQLIKITSGNMTMYYNKTDGKLHSIQYDNTNGSSDIATFGDDGKITNYTRKMYGSNSYSETNPYGVSYKDLFLETHNEYGVPNDSSSDAELFYKQGAADLTYAEVTAYLLSGNVLEPTKRALAGGDYAYINNLPSNDPDSSIFERANEIIDNSRYNPKNTGTKKYKSGTDFINGLRSKVDIFDITRLILAKYYNIKEIYGKCIAGAQAILQTK